MKIEKRHKIFIVIAIIALVLDVFLLFNTPFFVPVLVIIVTMGAFQFWGDYFKNQADEREVEAKFPDFVRNLVGAIKSGMPAPNAIIHVSTNDYGILSKHVKKLANQIEWCIPLHKALKMFANETRNAVIKRAISTVIEAEMAGGNIEDVLESITNSVVKIKKMKQKRRASIHSQIIQSYIIFFVFLAIMVIIQNVMIPYMSDITQESNFGSEDSLSLTSAGFISISEQVQLDFSSPFAFSSSLGWWVVSLNGIFVMLAIIQGLFAGLVIGKLAEGVLSAGVKHSLILITIAIFVMSLAQGFV